MAKVYRWKVTAPAKGVGYGENRRILDPLTKEIELTLDINEIFKVLGEKAIRSKSGRSKALNGMVKVKVMK